MLKRWNLMLFNGYDIRDFPKKKHFVENKRWVVKNCALCELEFYRGRYDRFPAIVTPSSDSNVNWSKKMYKSLMKKYR